MFEIVFRAAAVGLLLLLAALLFRDARRVPAGRYGALFALGVAATLVAMAPDLASADASWLVPLRLLSFGNPVVFWLLAATLFDDEFEPSGPHAIAWLALSGLGFWCLYGGPSVIHVARGAVSVVFFLLGVWQAMAGRAADLVEPRRRFRTLFVISVAVYAVTIIASEPWLRGNAQAPFAAADALGSLAMTAVFAMALLSVAPEGPLLSAPGRERRPSSNPPGANRFPIAHLVDDPDAALLAALQTLMDEHKVYREEGLSVAALAQKLGIPEYRLRRLINQRLGHRNFNAFLNLHRLGDATAALADPTQAAVPVLTIALDAGFQSVGPFNRAFKAHTGVTPTEFRRRNLEKNHSAAA